MKKIMIAAVMIGLAGGAHAADFGGLSVKAAELKAMAVSDYNNAGALPEAGAPADAHTPKVNSYSQIPVLFNGDVVALDGLAGAAAREVNKSGHFGIQLEEPSYVIVLASFNTKEEAMQGAKELNKKFPNSVAVMAESGFLVIYDTKLRKKGDALLKAIEVKDQSGIALSLLRVGK